jgi:AcrR family transcriptional regulator
VARDRDEDRQLTGGVERPPALTRERLVDASIEQLEAEGIAGLSMRTLADRLGVKAASLYWHVRDRGELLELVASALLDEVEIPADDGDWRTATLDLAASVGAVLARHRDGGRVIVEAPAAVDGSAPLDAFRHALATAGLSASEAAGASRMILDHLLLAADQGGVRQAAPPPPGRPATVVVETGSRGVLIRAGIAVDGLARPIRTRVAAASVRRDGSMVRVRRVRGTGRAVVELDPGASWSVRINGATLDTRLELDGLALAALKVDGGASRVEAYLPRPAGRVPIDLSGGAVGVHLHRPPGVLATAGVSVGALQVHLDGSFTRAALVDADWTSRDAEGADAYRLRISGGAVDVTLDERAPAGPPPASREDPGPNVAVEPLVSIGLLLDGIEARTRR